MSGKRGTSRTHRCPEDHKHGATGNCYSSHRCGCDDCLAGNTYRMGQRRKLHAYGRAQDYRVDKTAAAERVHALRGLGWTVQGIAERAGVPRSVVDSLLSTRYKRTTRVTAEAILAVRIQFPPVMKWKRVPVTGTQRRLEALAYMGWSIRHLERLTGMGDGFLSDVMRHADLVHESTAARIATIYDELWDKQPPRETKFEKAVYTRTRIYARKQGWLGPLSWDDIDADVDPVKPDQSKGRGWVLDELEHLRALGESADTAATLLGEKPNTMAALAYRHGRRDIGRWIERAVREGQKAS